MTPQERALVDDLFDRLAKLESAPRDPDAEQAIRAGIAKAPNALYALTQSVLVQDEALKRADAHIRELEGGDAAAQDDGRPKSFLDNMRDALLGHDDRRGSVPTVRPGVQTMDAPPQSRPGVPWGTMQPAPTPYAQDSRGGMMGGGMFGGGGGSFLGTAAAAAAGMIGGGLLLGGIRNMLGGSQNQGPFAGTFNQVADNPANTPSPWSNAGGGDLSRQAGLDDIGSGGSRQASNDAGGSQGLFGGSDNNGGHDDASFNDDAGGFDGGGSDTA